ncbi:MAG: hypothetical protein U9N36_01730, partial [Euryarchaeota archaeon]|nr:hypothetical protein [Euryarchaeota archaeon]
SIVFLGDYYSNNIEVLWSRMGFRSIWKNSGVGGYAGELNTYDLINNLFKIIIYLHCSSIYVIRATPVFNASGILISPYQSIKSGSPPIFGYSFRNLCEDRLYLPSNDKIFCFVRPIPLTSSLYSLCSAE